MTQGPTAATALFRLRDWFTGCALPLWLERGYDRERGGFYEALNFDASPSDGRPRRVRGQARQIHAFSQAGLYGWGADAEALAAEGFDFFLKHACPEGGVRGCVFHLDDKGAVIDDRRDLYDQGFLLLACASRWAAAKDERALELAENTIAFLDRELLSPHGGWLESDRSELPRRQNPHMHLFEAFIALYTATGEETYLTRAGEVRSMFERIFFAAAHDAVREFFDAQWVLTDEDQPLEPGHMLEWSWLLGAHDRLTAGDSWTTRTKLYDRARAIGADPGFFHFYDNVSPLEGGQHSAKRLWPQTEGLRAALSLGEVEDAEALAAALLRTYLATDVAGLWIDEFDAEGRAISTDTPASILYHIFEAVAETDAYLKAGEAG